MVQVDEQDLLVRAGQGDAAAFAELVRSHQTAVFNVAYRLLGNRQEAEDAAQEAFVRAFRAMDRFDVTRPFAPWIKRIAANLCLNRLESMAYRQTTAVTDLARPGQDEASLDNWAHQSPTPEQATIAREESERLRAAIWQLPPRFRMAIELRHFQEMSYDEIAKAMARPLSSVKSDLFRARKLLAEKLREK
ncbi:MAG: RNA polymerase sigma factor [Anaerolineae bacterium]